MNHAQIKSKLGAPAGTPDEVFALVRSVAYFYQDSESDETESLDLIIRLIERRAELEQRLRGVGAMIDAISREAGLFPYIKNKASWHDELAIETMRAPNLTDIVFHIEQASVFNKLAEGRSIILSAPTSFGKSLLIDALISSKRPNTVVAVVPTIALLDEFRRRMVRRFPDYQIITNAGEVRAKAFAIYIGTQERLLERDDIEGIDFFVVDEFYKLDLERNDQRSVALNAALAKFGKTAKQVYFLGPSIDDVPNAKRFREDLEFIRTRYSPVTADIIDRTDAKPTPARLLDDIETVKDESSLIYVRSPRAAWTLAYDVIQRGLYSPSDFCGDFGEWIKESFHPEWVLGDAVSAGIGMHHGRIPRSVAYLMISMFNKGEIGAILCTSSMIEGVNTAAQNVFIYDRHISTNKLDRFTFDNIKGRAGRMFRHSIGKIYLYNTPPDATKFDVRVPLFDSDERLVPELLVQLDDRALTDVARRRKRALTDASLLPPEVLKRWAEFGFDELNNLADLVSQDIHNAGSALRWNGIPRFAELEAVFTLVWNVLKFPRHDMRSPRQVAYFASTLWKGGSIRKFMDSLVQGQGIDVQQSIDQCFNFLRGAEYTFPQVLRATNDVIDSFIEPGLVDYRVYAQHLQNLFMGDYVRTLDEYGAPIPLIQQLSLAGIGDLDALVASLRDRGSSTRSGLSPLEAEILERGMALE